MHSSLSSDHIFEQWLKALGGGNPRRLNRRLGWDDLDQVSAHQAFEEDKRRFYWDDNNRDKLPDWMITLGRLQEAIKASTKNKLDCAQDHLLRSSAGQLPFCDLWLPAVDASLDCLRLRVDSLIGEPIPELVERQFAGALLTRLCLTGERVLWDLFQSDRGAGVSALAHFGSTGENKASPPREAYQRFIQRHRDDGLVTVLAVFPVLGRLLADVARFWLDSSTETLIRIHKDRHALAVTFDIPLSASLDTIRFGLGDYHHQGRTVASLEFSDGYHRWSIVYKPRDMRIDFEFQRLLKNKDILGDLPPMASLRVWHGEGYGYMEFVQHVLCRDEQERELFYVNAGRLSALLYVFGYTDGHRENLIASGSNLHLIDGETLLAPTLKEDVRQPGESTRWGGKSALHEAFNTSIARTELLPAWVFVGPQREAIDMSAFGAESRQDAFVSPASWLNINTDLMARGNVQMSAPAPAPVVAVDAQASPFAEYSSQFTQGFRAQCEALAQQCQKLLAPAGVVQRFAGLNRRYVVRATRVYGAIQTQQLESASLKSVVEHRLRLEQLARLYLTAPSRPASWPVFAQERRQLAQLDIPYFAHRTDETRLCLGGGAGFVEGLFETSGLQACRLRLEGLDRAAIDFQLEIVHGMTAAKQLRIHAPLRLDLQLNAHPPTQRHPPFHRPGELRLGDPVRRQVTQDIASDLIASAHGGSEWLGFDLAADGQRFLFRPLSLSLYSGAAGIAVFFANLANSTAMAGGDRAPNLQALANRILHPLWRLDDGAPSFELKRWWRDQSLGLAGAAGQLLALLSLDASRPASDDGQPGRDLARKIVEALDDSLLVTAPLALMDGIVGLVGALLMLNTNTSMRLARVIGDRLAECRLARVGFSTGAAGILAALAQLHARTGTPRYLEAARTILADMRAHVGVGAKDLARYGQADPSWCTGLSGLALGRLCLVGTVLWDADTENETHAMLGALGAGSPTGDCLCCGPLGPIAVLRIADEVLGKPGWSAQADKLEAAAFGARFAADGPHRFHLGLMHGPSGRGLILIDEPGSRRAVTTLLGVGLLGHQADRP